MPLSLSQELFVTSAFHGGVRRITTSSCCPQASQVERFTRNLKVALAIYHNVQHDRWDENILYLTMAFNSAWHESTGATAPYYL
jgi:hypothetical protein